MQTNLAGIRTSFKQLPDRNSTYWVSKIRRKFSQWCQDKPAVRVPGMRNNQVGGSNLLVSVKKNVDINGAWSARLIPDTTGFAFNKETAFQ
jgi:hypothetical protein